MKTIPIGKWNKLIESFREKPADYLAASRHADVHIRTAVKAWKTGFPKLKWSPISEIIKDDQVRARAFMHKKETIDVVRDDAEKEAVKAKAQEGEMIKAARNSSIRLLAMAAQLSDSALKLGTVLKRQLDTQAQLSPLEAESSDIDKNFEHISKAMRLNSSAAALAHEVMQMERLHLGEPNQVIGVKSDRENMSRSELAGRLESAIGTLKRAHDAGGLDVEPKVKQDQPLIGKPLILS